MIKAPVFVFIKLFPSSDILRKNGFQIVANMHSHILLLFICNHRHTYNHIQYTCIQSNSSLSSMLLQTYLTMWLSVVRKSDFAVPNLVHRDSYNFFSLHFKKRKVYNESSPFRTSPISMNNPFTMYSNICFRHWVDRKYCRSNRAYTQI